LQSLRLNRDPREGLPALSRLALTAGRCTNAFDFGRAFRRGLRAATPPFALGIGLHITDRLRLRFNWLRLRIADRLGQHLMQLGLGRRGRLCHLGPISLSTSRLPWPSAQPSIVRNFSRRPPALPRIPLVASVYRRAETPSPDFVAPGPFLFYRSLITSNFSDHRDDDSAATVCRGENRRLSLPIRFNGGCEELNVSKSSPLSPRWPDLNDARCHFDDGPGHKLAAFQPPRGSKSRAADSRARGHRWRDGGNQLGSHWRASMIKTSKIIYASTSTRRAISTR
jgi:hypothetical protein